MEFETSFNRGVEGYDPEVSEAVQRSFQDPKFKLFLIRYVNSKKLLGEVSSEDEDMLLESIQTIERDIANLVSQNMIITPQTLQNLCTE